MNIFKKILNSLWVLFTFIPLINGLPYIFIGLRAHKEDWYQIGIMLEIPWIILIFFLYFSKSKSGILIEIVGLIVSLIVMFFWALGIAGAVCNRDINSEYLKILESSEDNNTVHAWFMAGIGKKINHEKIESIKNSPDNEEIFKNKPALKNYLDLVDEFIKDFEFFSKDCGNFYNNYDDFLSDILTLLKSDSLSVEDWNHYGDIIYNINALIIDFNKSIENFNRTINRFKSFNELSVDEINYYNKHFKLSAINDVDNFLNSIKEQFDEIGDTVSTNTALEGASDNFDVSDIQRINHFYYDSRFKNDENHKNNFLPFFEYYYIHDPTEDFINEELEESGLNDLPQGNSAESSVEDKTLEDLVQVEDSDLSSFNVANTQSDVQEIVNINKDSEEKISSLPGFNFILAKRVIKSREKGIYFSSLDDLINLLNLKPHMIYQLEPLVSFDMENENIKTKQGRKLDLNDSKSKNTGEKTKNARRARKLDI